MTTISGVVLAEKYAAKRGYPRGQNGGFLKPCLAECGAVLEVRRRQFCEACRSARAKAYSKQYYRASTVEARKRQLAKGREWAEANPDKVAEYQRRYRERNADKMREQRAARYWSDPDLFRKRARASARKKTFGLTQPQFDEMAKHQGGLCALCGERPTKRGLCVDHNHATGVIRELLCSRCNVGLGMFRERMDLLGKAITYLRKHS